MGMDYLQGTGSCGTPSTRGMQRTVLAWQIHIPQATLPEFLKMLIFLIPATTDPLDPLSTHIYV